LTNVKGFSIIEALRHTEARASTTHRGTNKMTTITQKQDLTLHRNGYRWTRNADMEKPIYKDDDYRLITPDFYVISVEAALAEIETGVEAAIAARAEAKAAWY
jgi:hypothetical protein